MATFNDTWEAELVAQLASEPSNLLTIGKLSDRIGVSRPTPWRWAQRGIGGVRLPSILDGGQRKTSVAAYQAWVQYRTNLANGKTDAPCAAQGRDRVASANSACEELGV